MSSLAIGLAVLVMGAAPAPEKSRTAMLVAAEDVAEVVRPVLVEAGLVVQDATRISRELGGFGVPIDGTIPVWVDAALRKDWEEGAAACRSKSGPPPYPGKKEAIFCGMDLSRALWQRYLDRQAPGGTVYSVGVECPGDRPCKIGASAHGTDELTIRALQGTAPDKASALGKSVELVRDLLKGKGTVSSRKVVRDLPRPAPGSSSGASEQVAIYPGVPVPSPCVGPLPAELRIRSETAQAKALAMRWIASIKSHPNKGPPMSCAFEYAAEVGDVAGIPMANGSGSLQCERFTIQAGKVASSLLSGVEERVTGKAIKGLLEQLCGKPSPEQGPARK